MKVLYQSEDAFKTCDRWCVYSHFDKNSQVEKYVLLAIEKLKTAGFQVLFVSTSPAINEASLLELKLHADCVVIRENIGYDFGSYKLGIEFLRKHNIQLRQLLITNDSVFGPFNDLTAILNKATDFDIYGMTDSIDFLYHLQSYFIIYNQRAVNSKTFFDFWNSVQLFDKEMREFKVKIIEKYEIGGSQLFLKNGFKIGVAFSFKNIIEKSCNEFIKQIGLAEKMAGVAVPEFTTGNNLTHSYWRKLLELRCPYIKRELLTLNPTKTDIHDWPDQIKRFTNYDIRYIVDAIINHSGGIDFFYTNEKKDIIINAMTIEGNVRLGLNANFKDFSEVMNAPIFRDYKLDQKDYLETNPDVKAAIDKNEEISAAHHFFHHGRFEERNFKLVPA